MYVYFFYVYVSGFNRPLKHRTLFLVFSTPSIPVRAQSNNHNKETEACYKGANSYGLRDFQYFR